LPYLKDKATFYVFFYPLPFHKNAKDMSLYILNQKDKAKALLEIANGSKSYKEASLYSKEKKDKLFSKVAKNMQIANTLGVRGTPSLFDKDGNSVNWTTLSKKYKVDIPVDLEGIKYLIKEKAYIKMGKGKEPLYVFTDTECLFCLRKFKDGSMDRLGKKYDIYVFLFPLQSIHPKALGESVFIMSRKSEKEKKDAFIRLMKGGDLSSKELNEVKELMKNKTSEIMKRASIVPFVAQKLGIRGTPTFIDRDGKIVNPNQK